MQRCPCDELFIMLLPVLLNLQSCLLFWEWSDGIWLLMPLPSEKFFTGRTIENFGTIIWHCVT